MFWVLSLPTETEGGDLVFVIQAEEEDKARFLVDHQGTYSLEGDQSGESAVLVGCWPTLAEVMEQTLTPGTEYSGLVRIAKGREWSGGEFPWSASAIVEIMQTM